MQLQRQTNLIGGVIGGVSILVALAVVRCIYTKDKDDKSALFKAAEHGNATMVKLLLTLGANPNIFVSTNHPCISTIRWLVVWLVCQTPSLSITACI